MSQPLFVRSVIRLVFLVLLAIAALHPAAIATTKKPPARPININYATSAELQQVPGIGPSTADKILQMRKSYGAFKSVDDLKAIRGIGPKRFEKIHKYLTVGKPAQLRANSPDRTSQPANPTHTKQSGPATQAAFPHPQTTQPKQKPADTPANSDEESE